MVLAGPAVLPAGPSEIVQNIAQSLGKLNSRATLVLNV